MSSPTPALRALQARYSGNRSTRTEISTPGRACDLEQRKLFNKFNGSQTGNSVFDVGAAGTAFDARQASGVSVAKPGGTGPKFVGFYWGTRGSDFKPRLGEATSTDGSTWTKVAGTAEGGAVLALPNANQFNKGGERDPSILYDSGTYNLYFTALDSGGAESIGFSSTMIPKAPSV
jgi:hypothetical protein